MIQSHGEATTAAETGGSASLVPTTAALLPTHFAVPPNGRGLREMEEVSVEASRGILSEGEIIVVAQDAKEATWHFAGPLVISKESQLSESQQFSSCNKGWAPATSTVMVITTWGCRRFTQQKSHMPLCRAIKKL